MTSPETREIRKNRPNPRKYIQSEKRQQTLEMEERKLELKNKQICRFCLSTTNKLSIICSKENRVNFAIPLPLQIMACVSIEVFSNDGMPTTICTQCSLLMDFCYRFKQMCKNSETLLKQYPLTGEWPAAMVFPKLPVELEKVLSPKKPVPFVVPVKSPVVNQPKVIKPLPVKNPQPISPSIPVKSPNVKLLYKQPKLLNKSIKREKEPAEDPILVPKTDNDMEFSIDIFDEETTKDPIKFADRVETNVFPCTSCDRSFPLLQLLELHRKNHTRERDHECQICEKRFFSKYDLSKHMNTHTGEKPFQCVACLKAFSRSTMLHRHQKIHTDCPKFQCGSCPKNFLCMEELEKHMEKHKKNRPFQCQYCPKAFAFKQGLERHEIVHKEQQPYQCQYCSCSFNRPSKLSRHLTAHAGERPFPCRVCPKSFLLSHHLSRHQRSHGQIENASYKCSRCEESFLTFESLIYHSAVHTTESLICPVCRDQFESVAETTKHIQTHLDGEQFACEFCDLIFNSEDRLVDHSIMEHVEEQKIYDEDIAKNILVVEEVRETDSNQGNEYFTVQEILLVDEEFVKDEAEILKSRRPKRGGQAESSAEEEADDPNEDEDFVVHDISGDEDDEDDEDYEEVSKKKPASKRKLAKPAAKQPAKKKEKVEELLAKEAKSEEQTVKETTANAVKTVPKEVTVKSQSKPARPGTKDTPTTSEKKTPNNFKTKMVEMKIDGKMVKVQKIVSRK